MKVLKAKKEADTNFVLLCQLKNMVGQFKKAYLHRQIKIVHFATAGRIQNSLTHLRNILAFLTITRLQAESCI